MRPLALRIGAAMSARSTRRFAASGSVALCLVAWGASSQRSPEAEPVRAGRQRAIVHHTALPLPASRAVASAVGQLAVLVSGTLWLAHALGLSARDALQAGFVCPSSPAC